MCDWATGKAGNGNRERVWHSKVDKIVNKFHGQFYFKVKKKSLHGQTSQFHGQKLIFMVKPHNFMVKKTHFMVKFQFHGQPPFQQKTVVVER